MLLSDPELTVAQRMAQHALQIFQGELDRELNQEKQAQELRRLLEHSPEWFQRFFGPMRYKASYGGRAGGKSHSFAEYLIARMVVDADLSCVCIREIQKSLKSLLQIFLVSILNQKLILKSQLLILKSAQKKVV
jgi:phage terminase large subunit